MCNTGGVLCRGLGQMTENKKMQIKSLVGICLFCLVYSTALNAASIVVAPNFSSVRLGESVSLDLVMDFSDVATMGSGLDLFFDTSALHFSGFTFAPSLPTDPAFTHVPVLRGNHLEALAFGSFEGISGPATIGTLTLDALSVGRFDITLALTQSQLWGDGFYNAADFSPIVVDFGSATVNVSAVPNPPAIWMLLSGMALLAMRARRLLTR